MLPEALILGIRRALPFWRMGLGIVKVGAFFSRGVIIMAMGSHRFRAARELRWHRW
jgi:hypothetical protein